MFKTATCPPQAAGRGRLVTTLTLTALALLLSACGGGSSLDSANDDEVFGLRSTSVATRALPVEAEPQARTVQLEGCVVDGQWLSAPGVAVHVRTADGRTVGTAFTDARGVFALAVPARSALLVATDWAGPGALILNTGNGAVSVAACLPTNL